MIVMTRIAVVSALLLAACGRNSAPAAEDSAASAATLPEGHVPVTRAIPLDAKAQAMIDAANTDFAAKDYREALSKYRKTLELAPGHPAPWWGISMAANMLGDSALADSAMRMLRQGGVEPGDQNHSGPKASFNPHKPAGTGS